jgi:phosphopantothenate-cysteine ligase
MIKVAITAGGTSENIDGVRKLTNVSTGQLGWQCLGAAMHFLLSKNEIPFKIFYIYTETSFRKETEPNWNEYIDFLPVTDVQSVYETVDFITKNESITHFIHSMAISDFTFSYAVSIQKLAEELFQEMTKKKNLSVQGIEKTLQNPKNRFTDSTKLSSKDSLLLGLKTTPKVISLIKKNNKNTFLVGFKLLRNVTEEALMEAAQVLVEKNGCDMVFANELSTIAGSGHTGILIKNNAIVARPAGKEQIATTIIEKMFALTL